MRISNCFSACSEGSKVDGSGPPVAQRFEIDALYTVSKSR